MALFKLRKGGEEAVAAVPRTETVEAMRRRARHRLIGAAVLVLLGVVGFPLLFDTQPRPIPVDIPIEIPDRNKVQPLPLPPTTGATPAAHAPATNVPATGAAVSGAVTPASTPTSVAAASKPADKPFAMAKTDVAPASRTEAPAKTDAPAKAEPAAKQEARAEPKLESKPDAKAPGTAAKSDDGARAQALLEGKAEAVAAEGRFIVQVGAFSDAAKARETRLKVERAGLKTYTHIADTKEGKLIRVRVGPFASRAEADKAAQKIKGLDLQAKILTL